MGTRLSLHAPIGYLLLFLARHAYVCDGHVGPLNEWPRDLQEKTWKMQLKVISTEWWNYGTQYLSSLLTGGSFIIDKSHVQHSKNLI